MGIKSREMLEKSGKVVRLRLGDPITGEDGKPKGIKSTGKHTVKLITEKESERLNNRTGKEEKTMKYLFEENGTKKYYETPMFNKKNEISYFVERMAEINEGDTIILEMKKQGLKNYISISLIKNTNEVEVEDEDDYEEQELEDTKE